MWKGKESGLYPIQEVFSWWFLIIFESILWILPPETHTQACTYTHTCMYTHLCTFTFNFKELANLQKPMHISMNQVKDSCDGSWCVASEKANMIKSILLFILFQWHFALVRTSPNSLMWFSMPFTSPVSHLGIPLSPVSSSCSPLYSPALPHLQPRAAATSFCSHCGLSCLCKCQASSWSFFPSHPTFTSPLLPSPRSGSPIFQVTA